MADFIGSLENGRQISVTSQDARNTVELCTALYASAITRQAVDLPLLSNHRFYAGVHKNDYQN